MAEVDMDAAFNTLTEQVGAAFGVFGTQCRRHIRNLLGVPVRRGLGGIVIERSKKGESPRRETNELRQGIAQQIEVAAGKAVLLIYSPTPYSVTLQYTLNRPHWKGAPSGGEPSLLDFMAERAERVIADALNSSVPF